MKKIGETTPSPGWGWRKNLRIMKLCMLFIWVSVLQVSAVVYAQNVRLDLTLKDASIEKVMTSIRSQSEFSFFYDDAAVDKISNITLNLKDATVDEVMEACLKGTGFSFRVIDKTIILYRKEAVQQQVKETVITGKVTDQKGKPLPGVTIRLDGTTLGVVTDAEGNYVFRLPMEKGNLIFSFIGFKTRKETFAGTKKIDVKLEEDVAALDEVSVVAYGSQKKRLMTSAVSSVKADDIKELPTHSLESLLQGHMAGVEVNNLSGAPGGGGSIVAIRGYNSFFVEGEGQDRAMGTPLYVVDGVPIQAFTSPVTGANTLSDIDPSMIESIEVLKDAASAAIYGSRAGNGVILITTKKGRAGKAKFTANVSYSASWLPATPEQTGGNAERRFYLNALRHSAAPYYDSETGEWKMTTSNDEVYHGPMEYGPLYDWFWQKTYSRDAYVLQDSLNPFYNNSTNWWKYAYRMAKVWNANIQASGGNETIQYMVGAGYYNEEGIMLGSGFQRINIMSNLTAQPTPKLRLDSRLGLSYSDRSRGGQSQKRSGLGGQKIEGVSVDPTRKSSLYPGSSYVEENLLEELNTVQEKNNSYSARYSMMLDYEFIKNLHLSVSGSVDFNQQNQNHFEPSTLDRDKRRSYSQGTVARSLSLLNENLLNYSFSVRNNHNFQVLLGLSFQKNQDFGIGGSGKGGPNDQIHYVENWGSNGLLPLIGDETLPQSATTYNSSFSEERMCSYFGRLTYNYKEKYLFEATLRRDGSSVFGENVRWATFPSVSAGWAFSEEPFMKKWYWLSFGKIRASWGTSGQKFSQRYLAYGLWSPTRATFEGKSGMGPDTEGGVINRNLTWEETDQWDIGLDLSFLDYRLKIIVDYYYRYTHEQLTKVDLPGNINYFDMQWRNALATSNQGLEVELQADIFRESAVKWRMKLNGSRNWNRFEKSGDGYDTDQQVIGKPIYQIWAYKTQGYYNSLKEVPMYYTPDNTKQPMYHGPKNGIFFPGTRKIADLNGDGTISVKDRYMAASPLPLFHGGFINEIRWKDFDLNIFFTYSLGRHILKTYDDRSLVVSGGALALLVDAGKLSSWQNPQSGNPDYPRIQYYEGNKAQFMGDYDCDIEKVNMIRLKQLTLGYNLNEKVTRKLGVSSVRIFTTFENLFLLTNYSGLDPEIVSIYSGMDNLGSYPLPRKFTVGLTVNF